VNTALGGVANKFVWEIQTHFLLHKKHLTMYMAPKFGTTELDTASSLAKQF
jgi:hypothetical protein